MLCHDPDFKESDHEHLAQRGAHVTRILKNFWRRWKREYLTELSCATTREGTKYTLEIGEIVTVYDENHPRGMWRLGRVEELIKGVDGVARGVSVRTQSRKGQMKTLHRPVQQIYPLEVRAHQDPCGAQSAESQQADPPPSDERKPRSKRIAALNSRLFSKGMMSDEGDESDE